MKNTLSIPCQFCDKNVFVSKTFSFIFKNLCEKIRKIAKIDKIFDKWHVFGTFLTRTKKPKNPDKMGTFWGQRGVLCQMSKIFLI